jgi:adenylate cyclase class 2
MREVEVKAHLRDRESVVAKLAALGCDIGEPVTQEDIVYVKKYGSMEEFLGNDLFLRIRVTKDQVIFTLKYHPDRTQSGSTTAMPIEHEVRVDSRPEMEAMLALLGFSPALRIYKERRTGHYQDWEICLDDVEELGSFIEIEQLIGHDEEVGPVRAKLSGFLESIGVLPEDLDAKRYDIQHLERQFSS